MSEEENPPAPPAPVETPPAPEGEEVEDARLAAARQEAIERRQALKPWREIEKDFGLNPEQVRDALAKAKPDKGDEALVDAEAIKRDARREADAAANSRIIRSEVKALAADLFADPADAPLYLDLSKFDVDDDGEIDEAEITAALKKVLERKPHLGKSRTPKPDKAQGHREAGTPSVQAGREMHEERHARKGTTT
jgi:hypothetical protein